MQNRYIVVAIGLAVIAGGAAFAAKQELGGSVQRSIRGPSGDGFAFSYPAGWQQVSPPSIGSSQPVLAALENKTGDAEVLVHRSGRVGALDKQLVDTLGRSLRKSVPDFAFVSADVVHLQRGGKALFFSYVRTKAKRLVTVTVVPDGGRSYVIDSVSAAADHNAALGIGSILQTFQRPS